MSKWATVQTHGQKAQESKGNPHGSLPMRVLSSCVFIPILYAALFTQFGAVVHLVIASVIQGWAMWEFFTIAERKGVRVPLTILIILGVALQIVGFLGYRGVDVRAPLTLLAVSVPSMLFFWQMFRGAEGALRDVSGALLGFVYASVPLGLLFAIRQLPNGAMLIVLLLTANFCSDIGAYFVGTHFGRHKLCPSISPKKTIEGAFGAVAGALLGTLALGFLVQAINGEPSTFLGISTPGPTRYVHATALAVLLSIFGMIGDLGESLLKREAGVKDSGNLFPGHGGILDVIDALLFNTPIFYVYARLFFG